MSVFKKATAFLTALGLVGTMAGCGYNTRNALEVNGYQVPAGVYIYFANTAYNQAISQLKKEKPDLDTEDDKAVQAETLDGKDVRTWIEDKATEMTVDFVATEQKFDELGLTLSDEDELNLKSMMDYYWASNQEVMEKNGVGESSFKLILTSSYKSDAVFQHYYGIGGEKGVTEEDLADYYADNNVRAQYIKFSLTNASGEALEDAEKNKVKDMAKDAKDRVEKALASGGVEAVMAEMNTIKQEYDDYVSGSEAEEAETEVETEAADSETETEAADSVAETEAADSVAETEAAETEAEETEAEAETTEEETADSAAEEATTPALAGDTEETEAAEESSAASNSEEETAAETEAETEAETAAEEETETETAAEEESEAETAAEDETAAEEETTEAAEEEAPVLDTPSYTNETIISVVHPEDYDDPKDIYYNPSEKAYNTIVGIKAADYGKPFLVEEEQQYYLVVRYDIRDRMTADDLWTESAMNSANYSMHNKEFEDLLDTWTNSMEVKRNEAAYKRYDPFKFEFK